MELEAKLDEDFLFYLNFTNTFLKRITDKEVEHKCRVWLYKLCGEPCDGIDRKRCRNMYLANLLICMQNGVLDRPFLDSPHDVDIINATKVFGPIPKTVEAPAWLFDNQYNVKEEDLDKPPEKKGRTYIATRTLPNGQGAFAYIGVSLSGEEPMWIGAGESSFAKKMDQKFRDMVPPVYEMEKILARRKDPREREKVLAFYDILMANIADELDGKDTDENETVEGLIMQLVHDLTEKGMYEQYQDMEESDRRVELLLMLYERVKARRDKVARREELLDEIEERIMPKSFFEVSVPEPEDRYQFPAAMWEQAIDKLPAKRHMLKLQPIYPVPVLDKFLETLANYKEEVAVRMQRRHENIVTQMKRELRKEGEKKKKLAEEAQIAADNAEIALKAVREQYNRKLDFEKKDKEDLEGPESEHTKQYEEMKRAVYDQQKLVEEEALRGQFLAAQINAVTEQNEQFMMANEDMVKKSEQANMKILKNIKRLTTTVKMYEQRIKTLREMAENAKKGGASEQMFVF